MTAARGTRFQRAPRVPGSARTRGPSNSQRTGRTLAPTHWRDPANNGKRQRCPSTPLVPSWYLTDHARKRAAERSITHAELFQVVEEPEVTYDQSDHGPNRQVRQRGQLGVVVDRSTGAVITVVFRHHDLWLKQPASTVA